MTSLDIRSRLVEALKLDLVGPGAGHPFATERLEGWVRPSSWYLTGFLIPSGTPSEESADADEDDDFAEVPEVAGLAEESNEERKAAKKGFFPSSMGLSFLSFLVASEVRSLTVTIRWGDYKTVDVEGTEAKPAREWHRYPREEHIDVALSGLDPTDPAAPDRTGPPMSYPVPGSGGLTLAVLDRPITSLALEGHLPHGARSVSVFLVNNRPPNTDAPDEAFAFQAETEVRSEHGFVPRPDLRSAEGWDEQVADLHFSDVPEYATGHGVSAEWETVDGVCRVLRTAWIPTAEVERTETVAVPGVELSMDALGSLADAAAVDAALLPLIDAYRTWIDDYRKNLSAQTSTRCDTAEELLRQTGLAAQRIDRGIDLLRRDPEVLDAFRVTNRAVARALQARLKIEHPNWKAFQLAFVLLNLPGLADPEDPHRETVDFLFFPTGGGKTEAYLGLAAFAMVLRRLRHESANGAPRNNAASDGRAGCGVSVIMRYTLRLLTLDQLGRAAGLVCALELERERDPVRYGTWPFEVGLWVGKAATPNIMGRKGDKRQDTARSKTLQFKDDPRHKPSPIPLENCP